MSRLTLFFFVFLPHCAFPADTLTISINDTFDLRYISRTIHKMPLPKDISDHNQVYSTIFEDKVFFHYAEKKMLYSFHTLTKRIDSIPLRGIKGHLNALVVVNKENVLFVVSCSRYLLHLNMSTGSYRYIKSGKIIFDSWDDISMAGNSIIVSNKGSIYAFDFQSKELEFRKPYKLISRHSEPEELIHFDVPCKKYFWYEKQRVITSDSIDLSMVADLNLTALQKYKLVSFPHLLNEGRLCAFSGFDRDDTYFVVYSVYENKKILDIKTSHGFLGNFFYCDQNGFYYMDASNGYLSFTFHDIDLVEASRNTGP